MGKKTRRLSQLLYIDFWMLLQYVFRILQPETGYPFAECHFIRSLDISGKIGTVRIKYFGQFFYGKSLLYIAVCLYPVANPLYKFCIGLRTSFSETISCSVSEFVRSSSSDCISCSNAFSTCS